MGTPSQATWPEGLKLAAAMNFKFPTFSPTPLSKIVTNACPEAIDLMTALCHWDPNKRPTAVQVRARAVGGGQAAAGCGLRSTAAVAAVAAAAVAARASLQPPWAALAAGLPDTTYAHASGCQASRRAARPLSSPPAPP